MASFVPKPDNSFVLNNVGSYITPSFASPQTNPFGLSNVGSNSAPTFADLDGDGDLDAFIGHSDGYTDYFQNTGTATNPIFAKPVTNPFDLNPPDAFNSTPTFADIDEDGDLDAFIGYNTGETYYYQNTGTATNPIFANRVTNPFGLSKVGSSSAPTFADIDGDGDLDAFIGQRNANTDYYQNTGTATNPIFAKPVTNPFDLNPPDASNSTPTFADLDRDGDLDAFIGYDTGETYYYQNTGTAISPSFANRVTNPFGLRNVGSVNAPTFADIDRDGDLDAFIGESDGNTAYQQNSNLGFLTISPSFASPQTNLFGPIILGTYSAPTFADINGDGDLDAFIGDKDGNIYTWQNSGTAINPIFANADINTFGLSNVGSFSTPTFADIDGDGDLDAFIGNRQGNTEYFQNTGTATNPIFIEPVTNPFGLSSVGSFSAPTFADIDGDGDLDAFIGAYDANFHYLQNTGTATNPIFANPVTNPFGLSYVMLGGRTTFADIDEDGDLDAFIGDIDGNTNYFQNTGSATNPRFANPVSNPFGLSILGSNSAPTFADINADGDLDAFIGDKDGNINFFVNNPIINSPILSGAEGQKPFTIAAGDGTVKIANFGGVGQGANPSAATIAEVDTLQFSGAGLTPENLLLTQQGNDLVLSFEGVADPKVVLQDFALEDLDNLTQATGAAVDLGNILFDGHSQVTDSFDVFDANLQRQQVFHRNRVTFLNDLDNKTHGFSRSDDVINAQGGNDRINGRSGNDLLRGGQGRDKLIGGKGDDILVGGQDDDLLNGGRGKDTFVLAANAGTDMVKDFENGKDYLGLAEGLTFNQLTISQSNSNTLISVTNGGEVLASLTKVNANLIGAEDFTVV